MDHATSQHKPYVKQTGDSFKVENLPTQTVDLTILGGTTASYHNSPWPPNPSNPTLLMIPDFATTVDIFHPQLTNHELTKSVNMLAIEPLGHGKTRTTCSEWTNWDSSAMILATLDALKITDKVFITGVGQGGWIAAQIALLTPERVAGLVLINTSMDAETSRSRELGCWDAHAALSPHIDNWAKPYAYRLFQPEPSFIDAQIARGFGVTCSLETRDFWSVTIRENWSGENGRQRARMATVNVRDRESLHSRLGEIKCPVLWLQDEKDEIYSVGLVREEVGMLGNEEKSIEVLEGGTHYCTWTQREEVNRFLLEFVERYDRRERARTP